MCSIVASFDKAKLIELCKLNEYRGQQSHSISYYDPETGELTITRGEGPVDYASIEYANNVYCIVHMQAPTTQSTQIHPAQFEDAYLWHNGIIKESYILKMQEIAGSTSTWDTQLLLELFKGDLQTLSEVDGTFSCLLYNYGDLYLFRNEISPMFIDIESMTISSTKFEGSEPTEPNKIFYMDFVDKSLCILEEFKTAVNPFYFGDK